LLWPLAIIVPVVAALFIRRRPRMQQVDRSAD
jgi:hypothetical protein